MAGTSKGSVLLIDDSAALLEEFEQQLRIFADEDEIEVRSWKPVERENPIAKFHDLVDEKTLLVVTDYDLTKEGQTGLFGASIVSWSQARFIPVGNFSRGSQRYLPRDPNLFELRVPTEMQAAVRYTKSMYRGFRDLRTALSAETLESPFHYRSPAEVLARLLGRPELEGQLTLYVSALGSSNGSLLDSLRDVLSPGQEAADDSEKNRLLAYVVGHVLANAIRRYPGPILSEAALCSYVATVEDEAPALRDLFSPAIYGGPFADDANFYWRTDVDHVIAEYSEAVGDVDFQTSGEFNRNVVEKALGRPLRSHSCPRCAGVRGGYWCPFTNRPVCDLAECSVAANSWIPLGADVCRVERDFYDEWAPMLGL